MDRQLKGLLNHQISVEAFLGVSGTGAPRYGEPVPIPCYITGEIRMVRNLDGDETVSSLTIFLSGTSAQEVGFDNPREGAKRRITLPDGSQPPILAISPYYDRRGTLDYVQVNL